MMIFTDTFERPVVKDGDGRDNHIFHIAVRFLFEIECQQESGGRRKPVKGSDFTVKQCLNIPGERYGVAAV